MQGVQREGWDCMHAGALEAGPAAHLCPRSGRSRRSLMGAHPGLQSGHLHWQSWLHSRQALPGCLEELWQPADSCSGHLCIARLICRVQHTANKAAFLLLANVTRRCDSASRCETCGWGGLNICNPDGDGSWGVEWHPVPCDHTTAGADTLRYEVDFANEWCAKCCMRQRASSAAYNLMRGMQCPV